MEQYISKSALLAEIDWLVNNYDKALDYEAALEDVRDFIDSLEVKESAEIQHINETCKENGDSLTQESVSEELEEAIEDAMPDANWYIEENNDTTGEDAYNSIQMGNMFKAGAKWQKKRDYIPLSDDINEVAKQICNKVLNCEIDYKEDDVVLSDEEECVKAGIRWQMQKESIPSKDLEELINSLSKRYPEMSFAKLSRIAVRVAKWQEDKDKQILNEEGVIVLPEEEFERMKRSLIKLAEREQQIMAKAIDGDITFDYYGDDDKTYGCIAHDSFCLEDLGLKDMDEVKILIFKK